MKNVEDAADSNRDRTITWDEMYSYYNGNWSRVGFDVSRKQSPHLSCDINQNLVGGQVKVDNDSSMNLILFKYHLSEKS